MGGCFSVSLQCDQVVNHATQWLCVKVSYIHNLKENLAALETTVEELKAKREDLSRRLESEENKGLQRLAEVQAWLTRVETVESQVNGLLSVGTTEIQRLCLCEFCSKSLKLSYRYGKRVFKMLKEVENLKANGVFAVIAGKAQASEVVERPIQPTIVGRETLLETVWNRLMEDEVSIMGLYGMGGVGKTTLLTQINNKFLKKEDAFVIWIVVSKELQIRNIQEEIAKKLELDGEDWNRKDKEQKACEIHSVLKRKKSVLLLDDIWEKVNLMEIGVPYPTKENRCKVVFTTRSLEVCGRMGANVEIAVQCLSPHDALELFKKKVGEITLTSHPDIPELAAIVAKKCQGLPLALNVIGETMACKRTIQEWKHAVDVLTSYAAEFSGMEDEILPILKFSYDNLKGEDVKLCFLYCTLFPEDHRIWKRILIDYWICEGFIDENIGMERAENKGYEIIGSLIRSSLLMENINDENNVYMHDVVREMALWIASDFGEQKDKFIVQAGVGLNEIPKVKDWKIVKRMSLMYNKIDHISGSLDCPELTTLFLQENKTLVSISGAFFLNMPRLVVLDLSGNAKLYELPDEISQLVSLKYLDMSMSGIHCLPVGFRELKNLIHLDLGYTKNLSSIVGISALLNLKVLKLWKSKFSKDINTVEELRDLEHLEVLYISIHYDSGLDQFFSSHNLMRSKKILEINGLQLDSSWVSRLASMEKLFVVHLRGCTFYEEKMDSAISIRSKMVPPLQNPTNACFLSLSTISIVGSKGLEDLTWLMFAPNLKVLFVRGADELEDMIHKEKTIACEESGIVPFRKLEALRLIDLPELKKIYWRPLPFPCLTEFTVKRCPKLRKLPLSCKSGTSGEKGLVIKYGERGWLEGVEWEDEATKARFLPSCIEEQG
ncbi:hypothetical protein Bca52824_009945 [Brassica carinata]|uniref:NB-ARC domain-containing protein n=1 Tax=Brassica carinata TaxID=52824 RepID=A0A8X8BA89_BRACI|nr:hypothetical protein Bca52824_009945 [Brassica carinata]